MDCISFSQITKNKISLHSQFDPQIESDFKGITESILIKGISHTTNINLKDNVIEHTPSESSARSTIFFINKKCLQQPRNNLNLYKSGYLEFVYVGIILQKRSSIITGCIQRHPSIDICTRDIDLQTYTLSMTITSILFQKNFQRKIIKKNSYR